MNSNKRTSAQFFHLSQKYDFSKENPIGYIVLYDIPDSVGYHNYVTSFYLHSEDFEAYYDRSEAIERHQRAKNKCFIDVQKEEVYFPQ